MSVQLTEPQSPDQAFSHVMASKITSDKQLAKQSQHQIQRPNCHPTLPPLTSVVGSPLFLFFKQASNMIMWKLL